MASTTKDYAGEQTIRTPKGVDVRAEVYWDTSDPQNVGFAYRIRYPEGHHPAEDSGPCDESYPWDDVYAFLGVRRYYVSTDSASAEYEAEDADAAARMFAEEEGIKGVGTADELRAYLERVGGYGSMRDETGDEEIFDVRS